MKLREVDWLALLMIAVCILLGVASHNALNPDGVSYLDLAARHSIALDPADPGVELPATLEADLRRTFRTMLSRIGVAPHVAELCLGHIEKETMRRVYDGHDYSGETADAWDRAGAHVAALRGGGANVIEMKRTRA